MSSTSNKASEATTLRDKFHQKLTHAENALLLIAPIGIWHGTLGCMLSVSLLAIAASNREYLQFSNKAWARLGVYLLIIIATAIFSPKPIQSTEAAIVFASGFAMVIPGLAIGHRLRNGELYLTSLLPVTILAIIYSQSPTSFEGRVYFGLRGNPNGTGYSLLFALIILGIAYQALAQNYSKQGLSLKVAIAANALAYATYLVISNHRTGWLAATAFFTMLTVARLPSSRVGRMLAILSGLAMLTALLTFLDLKDQHASIISQTNRLALWSTAIQETINNNPIFGSGFKSFREIIGVHSHQGYSRAFNHPHNIYVELFFSTGIAGIAATAWLVISLIAAVKRSSLNLKAPIVRACVAGITSLLIAFFLGKELASFEVTGSLSCLVGMLWAQGNSLSDTKNQPYMS